jgi:HD-GYP domain-containing protein (c-di-GMP phosphodiesterase class II)
LAQKIGWTDPAKVQLLALGALLHDFGHAKKTYQLFRPMADLELNEKVEYMKHSAEGADTVCTQRHFDQTVITIIRQHEELIDGSGYPGKLQEKNTDPLAVIVSTANDLDRMMLTENLPRQEAVKKFMLNRLGLHPLDHFKLLKTIG